MNRRLLKIIENTRLSGNYHLLSLKYDSGALSIKPGQFFNIKVSETYDPLLRRPLSYFSISNGTIKFLYRTVGKGTLLLSRKGAGETLDLIGPLGNGFDTPASDAKVCLVAGGCGAAPLFSLAEKLDGENTEYSFICGTKTKEEFISGRKNIITTTEDGTCGFKGSAVEKFSEMLKSTAFSEVYTCGPRPMMAETAKICRKNRIKCFVCLETQMACGIGVCLGCAVKTKMKNAYKFVCKDGPVFNSEEIEL